MSEATKKTKAKAKKGPTPKAPQNDADRLMQGKKPVEREITIYLTDDGLEEYQQVKQEVARMKMLRNSWREEIREDRENELEALQEKLDEMEEAMEADAVKMLFRSIGRQAFQDLMDEHPPTEEDHAEAVAVSGDDKAKAQFHHESFAPLLVQMSLVTPELSLEQVRSLFYGTWVCNNCDEENIGNQETCVDCGKEKKKAAVKGKGRVAWNDQEIGEIFTAAMTANTIRRSALLGK